MTLTSMTFFHIATSIDVQRCGRSGDAGRIDQDRNRPARGFGAGMRRQRRHPNRRCRRRSPWRLRRDRPWPHRAVRHPGPTGVTVAPEATKRFAIAKPRPCAPPVTMACWPSRSILFIRRLPCGRSWPSGTSRRAARVARMPITPSAGFTTSLPRQISTSRVIGSTAS